MQGVAFVFQKSDLHTNVSQTSVASSGETDGVRHRGSRMPSAASSMSDVTNAG